jgi:outer membrane protein TolC
LPSDQVRAADRKTVVKPSGRNSPVFQNARENLDYWDRELAVNRKRFNAGDLAQVDLNRLELRRVQFESDYETVVVNLRTPRSSF